MSDDGEILSSLAKRERIAELDRELASCYDKLLSENDKATAQIMRAGVELAMAQARVKRLEEALREIRAYAISYGGGPIIVMVDAMLAAAGEK